MGKIIKKGEKGAASNYITRSQAIKKLQLNLQTFRRICILKGIYPHEPKNKKKVGKGSTAPKTYYYRKDIQFLLHEPVLEKFREIRVHQRKMHRALTKREWAVAKVLESEKPTYRLDHIIKERYPTFNEALADLNDSVSMIFLFASLPSNGTVPSARIRNCQRLASEFQHYVIASSSLRKVFISIKGIYYQADIRGMEITWIVPHTFAQEIPEDVDIRIMSTFLELYEALMAFVIFKLYADMNLMYPPKVDRTKDDGAGGLAAYIIESADGNELLDSLTTGALSTKAQKKIKTQQNKRLQSLADKLATIKEEGNDQEDGADGSEKSEPANVVDLGVPKAVEAPNEPSEELPTLLDEDDSEQGNGSDSKPGRSTGGLFRGLVFFLSREVPRNALEFIIRALGGEVGWPETSGSGSPFNEDDYRITHFIIDRPMPSGPNSTKPIAGKGRREYLQPQWVFDCVNAGHLVKTKGYHPGETLPPHLSPFGGGKEGYVPPEASGSAKLKSAVAVAKSADGPDGPLDIEEEEDDGEVEVGERDEESAEIDEADDDGEEDADEEPAGSDDEDAIYKAELEAEAAGLSFSDYLAKKASESDSVSKPNGKKAGKVADDLSPSVNGSKKRKATQAELDAAEERELAKMMMSKKDRRLYNQIEFGKKKKEAEANKLRERREALEKQTQEDHKSKKAKTSATPAVPPSKKGSEKGPTSAPTPSASTASGGKRKATDAVEVSDEAGETKNANGKRAKQEKTAGAKGTVKGGGNGKKEQGKKDGVKGAPSTPKKKAAKK